eukprot:gene5471-3945_t
MSTSPPQPKWTRLPIRTRPHRNPLATNDDEHPTCPAAFQKLCSSYYPAIDNPTVRFVDVGCAFGGMLFKLAPMFPKTCMLGLEIRPKVVSFAQEKALALRNEGVEDGSGPYRNFQNVWFDQLNVMKFGSNCFEKGQLTKLFFCYPDPHWKRKNIRRRIISPSLAQEYAYWLEPGGLLYTVSDVESLEEWMIDSLNKCPLLRRLTEEELGTEGHQRVLEVVINSSEDAQRTERKGLKKHFAVHIRL